MRHVTSELPREILCQILSTNMPFALSIHTIVQTITNTIVHTTRLAGEPEDLVWTEEKATSLLASLHADPGKKGELMKLLSSSTNLETQIIAREMGAIADRVDTLEQQVEMGG